MPTFREVFPEIPVSISSNTTVSIPSERLSTFLRESIILASSPPDAILDIGIKGSPTFAEIINSTSSVPCGLNSEPFFRDTSKFTFGISRNASVCVTLLVSPCAARRRSAERRFASSRACSLIVSSSFSRSIRRLSAVSMNSSLCTALFLNCNTSSTVLPYLRFMREIVSSLPSALSSCSVGSPSPISERSDMLAAISSSSYFTSASLAAKASAAGSASDIESSAVDARSVRYIAPIPFPPSSAFCTSAQHLLIRSACLSLATSASRFSSSPCLSFAASISSI